MLRQSYRLFILFNRKRFLSLAAKYWTPCSCFFGNMYKFGSKLRPSITLNRVILVKTWLDLPSQNQVYRWPIPYIASCCCTKFSLDQCSSTCWSTRHYSAYIDVLWPHWPIYLFTSVAMFPFVSQPVYQNHVRYICLRTQRFTKMIVGHTRHLLSARNRQVSFLLLLFLSTLLGCVKVVKP